MTASEWLVLGLGAALIALINWYFFFAERSSASAAVEGGVQQLPIVVRGGYDPATIRVKAGTPVRLVFDRQETSGCSEQVVFPDFNVRKFLPPFERTSVEFTPPRPGTYEFTCGMGMLHGRVVAE